MFNHTISDGSIHGELLIYKQGYQERRYAEIVLELLTLDEHNELSVLLSGEQERAAIVITIDPSIFTFDENTIVRYDDIEITPVESFEEVLHPNNGSNAVYFLFADDILIINGPLSEHRITITSNSTVSDFTFEQTNTTVRFLLEKESGVGFCRISIPHNLLKPDRISVSLNNGLQEPLHYNHTVHDDGEQRWIYFTYSNDSCKITVTPKSQLTHALSVILTVATLLMVSLAIFLWTRRH